MKLKVVAIKRVAEEIIQIDLKPKEVNQILKTFAPGSHIEIAFGPGLRRRYSLVSSPENLETYSIAVLKVPNGVGSTWLHNHLTVNSEVESSGPFQEFQIKKQGKRHILIAGGIGITPILSFTRHLDTNNEIYEVHYSARSSAKMAFADELKSFRNGSINFYDNKLGQVMSIDKILASQSNDAHVYVCGPRGMIEAVRSTARLKGWDESSQIHFESFGQSGSARTEFKVELAQSNMTITVPANRSILDVAEEAGAWVNFECKRGECGKCVVEYSDGEVAHLDFCLTENARKTMMCPCVSRAKGNFLKLEI